MAKKKLSVLKRQRQTEKRRLRNRAIKSRVKTFIKKAKVLIDSKDKEKATAALKLAIRELDKAYSKGVLHRNNVARKKSRLMTYYNKVFHSVTTLLFLSLVHLLY